MPLQRSPDGPLYRRPVVIDGSKGVIPNSPDATAPCGCDCVPVSYTWHSIVPCSTTLPAVGDTLCCDTEQCLWISDAKFCEIIQDALDAGELDPACAQATAPCGLTFARDVLDGSACDTATPEYLLLWNNITQACYRLYLRERSEDGWGVAFGTVCREATTTTPVAPPGGDASDIVEYIGGGCTDAKCDGDSDGNPDPPLDPPTTADNTACGCDGNGSTGAIATVNVTECGCFSLGGTSIKLERLNKTVSLSGGPCFYTGEYHAKLTTYSDGTCTTVSAVTFPRVFVSATLSGGQWSVSVFASGIPGGGGNIFTTAAADGDCDGGSPANANAACTALKSAHGGTVTIVAGGLP